MNVYPPVPPTHCHYLLVYESAEGLEDFIQVWQLKEVRGDLVQQQVLEVGADFSNSVETQTSPNALRKLEGSSHTLPSTADICAAINCLR